MGLRPYFSRRTFLNWLSGLGIFAFFGCAVEDDPKKPRIVGLSNVSLLREGPNLFELERLVVFKERSELYVISLVCTHQTCLLRAPVTAGEGFFCPCHSSEFDSQGAVLKGPATEPLPHYELTVNEKGFLQANLSAKVPADWRLKLA